MNKYGKIVNNFGLISVIFFIIIVIICSCNRQKTSITPQSLDTIGGKLELRELKSRFGSSEGRLYFNNQLLKITNGDLEQPSDGSGIRFKSRYVNVYKILEHVKLNGEDVMLIGTYVGDIYCDSLFFFLFINKDGYSTKRSEFGNCEPPRYKITNTSSSVVVRVIGEKSDEEVSYSIGDTGIRTREIRK
ncbi:MAG: hypothetical protein JW976_14430 [Syntrophaceae bacterium]|nr:hypothetical protein [Syntrophaceae bacterium]